ncbi:molecular chaperone DnaJ [Salinarchaeum sp. Harcht-Bsk1]|uniref:DnaJ domain-containing protein n=1 Tax=Salinarchaeum sp. Harcht-Bsk1 TaxID=1333523 RepID=UPI0003423BE3|nr:J domain-containing protein [Salinarchaeum sp. Harcht-Bsk1]AGN02917.1 molecular chaperone DnaJ [Salinarchaeum sp. Harcht-Bsk1]
MPTTYYDVLGIESDATQDEIRDAYREKVKEYHPDVSDHPDAEERFKRVKRAEIVLADPEERSTYDRLGHDAYVDGDDPAPNQPTENEVHWAAAKAAQGEHDAGGGRSAGWRDRESRAHASGRAEWFWNDDSDRESNDNPFDGRSSRRESSANSAGPSGDPGSAPGGSSTATAHASAHVASHTAPDGWGDTDPDAGAHAVHEWGPAERTIGNPRPSWTQDDVVLLLSSLLLYPILLFLTVTPAFPMVARVAIGICTIALVAFLLPRPSFGLPVFGSWSILVPALLLGFGISPLSAAGLVTLGGVWLPLVYSIAVAMVLVR